MLLCRLCRVRIFCRVLRVCGFFISERWLRVSCEISF